MLSTASGATSLIAARTCLSFGCASFAAAAMYSSTFFACVIYGRSASHLPLATPPWKLFQRGDEGLQGLDIEIHQLLGRVPERFAQHLSGLDPARRQHYGLDPPVVGR